MITDFNLFENTTEDIQIGDYIFVNYKVPYYRSHLKKYMIDFLKKNIGIVFNVAEKNNRTGYMVEFHNIPSVIRELFGIAIEPDKKNKNYLYLKKEEILYSNSSLDDVKQYIDIMNNTEKYKI